MIIRLAIAVMLSALAFVSFADSDFHKENLEQARAKSESCVEPEGIMRRNHMEFLLHQRDDTTRKGIRTERYSLNNCISCHATKDKQGEYYPIDSPKHFCKGCHEYTGVTLDCFSCHATNPEK
jgi:hypothetical protein